MKLKNKKTGEIVELLAKPSFVKRDKENYLASEVICFDSLAELNEEWEDYEELKEQIMTVERDGMIVRIRYSHYKEAEKAVEKLKAWKRLKNNYHISFNLDFVKNTINFTYQINDTLHSVVNEERIVFEDMKTISEVKNERCV